MVINTSVVELVEATYFSELFILWFRMYISGAKKADHAQGWQSKY